MIGKAFGVALLLLTMWLSPAFGQSKVEDYYYQEGELNTWTTDEVGKQDFKSGTTGVKRVRVGRHPGYDRVVLEFDQGTPNYWVNYEKIPISLYGDQQIKVRGKAAIEISMSPVLYSEKNYNTPVAPIKRRGSRLRTPLITEVWSLGWFEGEVMYAIGLNSRRPFRVQTFSNPDRLVIEFKR